MAERPLDPALGVDGPFRWRVGAPLIVRALPLEIDTGFLLLAIISFGLSTAAVFWMLTGLGCSEPDAAGGAAAFALLGPAVALGLRQPVMSDPAAMAVMAVSIAAAVNGRPLLLAATLALGAVIRETFLIAGVASLFLGPPALRHRVRTGAISGLAMGVAASLWLRITLPPVIPYDAFEASRWMATHSTLFSAGARVVRATGATWGWLLPLAALQLSRPAAPLRSVAWPLIAVLAAAQMLLGHDVERYAVFGFPAIIAAATMEIARMRRERRWGWWPWAVLLGLQLPWTLRFSGLAPGIETTWIGAGLLLISLGLALSPLARRRRAAPGLLP